MRTSIIIPAHNEASTLADCLKALTKGIASKRDQISIVVVANGCTDNTTQIGRDFIPEANAAGLELHVLDTSIGDKGNAMNLGDQAVDTSIYIYLDADVRCAPGLIEALIDTLSVPTPRYASGDVRPDTGDNVFAQMYARIWTNLPFIKTDVCGCGLYAVNAAGRARWQKFPTILSDDKFVRLQFTPKERYKVPIGYRWPLPKSLWGLITVRSRWCRGNAELTRLYPELIQNEQSQKLKLGAATRLVLTAPASALVFTGIYAAARLRAIRYNDIGAALWERSR